MTKWLWFIEKGMLWHTLLFCRKFKNSFTAAFFLLYYILLLSWVLIEKKVDVSLFMRHFENYFIFLYYIFFSNLMLQRRFQPYWSEFEKNVKYSKIRRMDKIRLKIQVYYFFRPASLFLCALNQICMHIIIIQFDKYAGWYMIQLNKKMYLNCTATAHS